MKDSNILWEYSIIYFINLCSVPIISNHLGTLNIISLIGNSNKIFSKISVTSFSVKRRQLIDNVDTLYFSAIWSRSILHSIESGLIEFTKIIKGLFMFFSSFTVLSSALLYSSTSKSVKLPSEVITIPIVECSEITFSVPISAAFEKGIS